jgi:hypothetical protein
LHDAPYLPAANSSGGACGGACGGASGGACGGASGASGACVRAARASGERERRVPMQKMQGSDGRVLRRKTRSTAG